MVDINNSDNCINSKLSGDFSDHFRAEVQIEYNRLTEEKSKININQQFLQNMFLELSKQPQISITQSNLPSFKLVKSKQRDFKIIEIDKSLPRVEKIIINALADYLISEEIYIFTKPAFNRWCNENNRNIDHSRTNPYFKKFIDRGYLTLHHTEHNTNFYETIGVLNQFMQHARSVV